MPECMGPSVPEIMGPSVHKCIGLSVPRCIEPSVVRFCGFTRFLYYVFIDYRDVLCPGFYF